MSLGVQKFGGTSVADVERIRNVAKRVTKTYDEGNDVVVILSAIRICTAFSGLLLLVGLGETSLTHDELKEVLFAHTFVTTPSSIAISVRRAASSNQAASRDLTIPTDIAHASVTAKAVRSNQYVVRRRRNAKYHATSLSQRATLPGCWQRATQMSEQGATVGRSRC